MLIQGSQKWLERRLQGIGSSDAPIIMGVSPYSTPYALWEVKTLRSPGQAENDAMRYGKLQEPKARELYEKQIGFKAPAEFVDHPTIPCIYASLDGLNRLEGIVLEIKTANKEDHVLAISGKIPEKHKWQLVHQLMVAELDTLHYCSYYRGSIAVVAFKRDPSQEQILIAKEKEFWEFVTTNTPPPLMDSDYKPILHHEAIKTFDEYKIHLQQNNVPRLSQLEPVLIDWAAGKNIICSGVTISTWDKKVTINVR